MARLRLFGPLASAAGTREADIEGATVGECLDVARDRFGPAFADLLGSCRVAVGDRTLEVGAASTEPVKADTEIVLLPPVGGGAPHHGASPPGPPRTGPRILLTGYGNDPRGCR